MNRILVFFFLFALLIYNSELKATVINLSTVEGAEFISSSFFEVYEDTSGKLTLTDVAKNIRHEGTQKLSSNEHLKSAYWLKYEFYNDEKKQRKWVLEFIDPHISTIEVYFSKNNINAIKQGYRLPFSHKRYQHKNHVFDLIVPKGDTLDVYVRMQSDVYHGFILKLQTNASFTNYSLVEYYLLGIFYGVLAIMGMYNLILFIFTRNKLNLYYSLYVVSAAIISFEENGLGFQFLWPNFPVFNYVFDGYGVLLFLSFSMLYTHSFLDLKRRRFLSFYTSLPVYLTVVFIVYYLLSMLFGILPRYWILFYIVPFIAVIVEGIGLYKKGLRSIILLISGTVLITLSFIMLQLRIYGLVGNNIWQVYFFNVAAILEVLLFSLALGDKRKVIQQENIEQKNKIIEALERNEELKSRVNKELESKIKERTNELEKAKEKLEQQAHQITIFNLKLDESNRELSKKVKEVSKRRIQGSEIIPEEFHRIYPDKLACYQLLEEIKWQNGFVCKNCGGTNFTKGTSFRSRRCSKCGINESPTAKTVFHGLRIPIESAFYIFALIVQSKGKLSSSDLAEKSGVGQKACWRFKQKVVERMDNLDNKNYSWEELMLF